MNQSEISVSFVAASMLIASAHAAEVHDWYVLKTKAGAYIYDTAAIEIVEGTRTKSVSISDGSQDILYFIDCRTNRGAFVGAISDDTLQMAEGGAEPFGPGWAAVPSTGSMKIAADVACLRRVPHSIHADSKQAALNILKTLPN
jgi:hypothetical protein